MKKLINHVDGVVDDMLAGVAAAHPDTHRKVDGFHVIVRADSPVAGKVALVSGGGSGHEPAHGGYVGPGMLDGAVAGEVFTSPTPDQVFAAIQAVSSGSGVLLVVKNYTGDVMNFDMAAELAAAEGIEVAQVIVNDDVAVENSTYTAGRRGIAGTIFVHKIAGAAAEAQLPLAEVKRIAEHVVANVRSMGMALTPCIVPAAGKPSFTLADNEMEIGMGIHGEPGTHREAVASAADVATQLMDKILTDMPLATGDRVAVMINGLGATPQMELYILNKTVNDMLHERGVTIHRTYVGEYMTSLEMAGASVTLLKLDDELRQYLDAPAATPAFRV